MNPKRKPIPKVKQRPKPKRKHQPKQDREIPEELDTSRYKKTYKV